MLENTRSEEVQIEDKKKARVEKKPLPILGPDPNGPHLSTTPAEQAKPVSKEFLCQGISEDIYQGIPESCPLNHFRHEFITDLSQIQATTSYGGPGSKYKDINEDSFFFGQNKNGATLAGVIDGSGGSNQGYLAGKIANQALASSLLDNKSILESFKIADENVADFGNGGYATGIAVAIESNRMAHIAGKGDAKLLTLRDKEILLEGRSQIHSAVARHIERGILPEHAIHTSSRKNIVTSVIGNIKLPVFHTSFQTQKNDLMILASDGFWDVVSEYETVELAKTTPAHRLQEELFELAYVRNNSTQAFFIQFSKAEMHQMRPLFARKRDCRGDNITVMVLNIK
ncbi:MAG: hypothetical protein H7A33_04700 [Deltaproteobacteria bacterium]|nr:hypothetical protein [Deltaproteobacteria bacterium]